MTARPESTSPPRTGRLHCDGGRRRALLVCLILLSLPLPAGQETSRSASSPRPEPVPPGAVPADNFTPHGYLDNPYHSMVFNRSGILRSFPPLGLGWWRTDFEGAYGPGPRDHVNYLSLLSLAFLADGRVLASPELPLPPGTTLSSSYHTKNVFCYELERDSVSISARYFLSGEHSLLCRIELRNRSGRSRTITAHATHLYRLGDLKWWGRDGCSGIYRTDGDCAVAKAWAYGDVFALGSTLRSQGHHATGSRPEWLKAMSTPEARGLPDASIQGVGPLYTTLSYGVALAPGSVRTWTLCLSRGKTESNARNELTRGLKSASSALEALYADDARFWSRCPKLEGDWPDTWRRGWVYDFETLRMTVRPPLGIFKHPWDGMQVHSPRMVLGETSFDMMTLGYADPDLARDVLEGTFADALAPNVPCTREDGSLNMISADGSECGTAPMWGYPFQVIRSLYLRTGDARWVGRLYPGLKAYLEWWLQNRTDSAGWLHCNNSWESGQDGSRRFLVAEGNEGSVASFVRTVDVEASMAEAMNIMEDFAGIAGMRSERPKWSALATKRITHTRAMFIDGWFRDIDGRTNTPIFLPGSPDIMMLTPLTCRVATAAQVRAVSGVLDTLAPMNNRALEWPPGLFTYSEAAWNAGHRRNASEVVAEVADRVYRRTDSRTVAFSDSADPFSYRIPGVANEFWPARNVRPGGENYGWGAILPMFILRNIIGFREQDTPGPAEWKIAPSLPGLLMKPGKRYGLRNLSYRNLRFNLDYRCGPGDSIQVRLDFLGPAPRSVLVTDSSGRGAVVTAKGGVAFTARNHGMYVLRPLSGR